MKKFVLSLTLITITCCLYPQISPAPDADSTSSYYLDGGDTVWIISEDEVLVTGRMAGNQNLNYGYHDNSAAKHGSSGQTITINIGNEDYPIAKGLIGYNVGGAFDKASMPNDTSSIDQWQWMSDLTPEVLRFPSGSNSKFMHLLYNNDGSNSKGYGYDLNEIIRYYDWTDGVIDELH